MHHEIMFAPLTPAANPIFKGLFILFFIGAICLLVWTLGRGHHDFGHSHGNTMLNLGNSVGPDDGSLALRILAALPHLFVLAILGIVAGIFWFIVQPVILFTTRYPRGMWKLVVDILRWRARVCAYTLGLLDQYPPFSLAP